MEIEEILAALQSGKTVSKADIDKLITSMRQSAAGKKVDGLPASLTADEQQATLASAIQAVSATPEGKAQIQERIASRKEERFVKHYTPFFNAILGGADFVTSLNQIKASNKGLRRIAKPAFATPSTMDPALNAAIDQAQRGTLNAQSATLPAQQALQDQYTKDIALAKSIGGGQASTLGALGQVASLRRARGAANLVPLVDSIRAREQGRLDNLLSQRQQFNQAGFNQRFQNSQLALGQYNQEAQALGALGSAGRQNLRTSMSSLLNATPGIAARLPSFGDKYSDYEQRLNASLTGKPTQPLQSPYGTASGLTIDDSPSTYFNENIY